MGFDLELAEGIVWALVGVMRRVFVGILVVSSGVYGCSQSIEVEDESCQVFLFREGR